MCRNITVAVAAAYQLVRGGRSTNGSMKSTHIVHSRGHYPWFCIKPEAYYTSAGIYDEDATEASGRARQRNVKRPWSIFINTERRRCRSLMYDGEQFNLLQHRHQLEMRTNRRAAE